jgi:hypothetical protein
MPHRLPGRSGFWAFTKNNDPRGAAIDPINGIDPGARVVAGATEQSVFVGGFAAGVYKETRGLVDNKQLVVFV